MLRFLILLCCWSCCVGTSVAAVRLAPGMASMALSSQVGVLEDSSGRWSLDEVKSRSAEFRNLSLQGDAAINFGYSASAWWLRFTVEAEPTPQDMLLEIAFPTLDRVDYFGPSGEHLSAGDRLPFASRPVPHRHFVFPLRLEGAKSGTVWLRIESEGTLTIPLRLWQAEAFWRNAQAGYVVHSVFLGMLLALALYNLLQWISLRDHTYLTYVAFVLGMTVGQLSLSGQGNEFLWPNWPAWGNLTFVIGFAAAGLFGALMTRDFLDTRRRMPRVDGAVIGLAVLFALCIVISLAAPYRLVAILTTFTGISFSLLAVLAGIRSWRTDAPGAVSFVLAWALLLLGVVIFGLGNMNVLPSTSFGAYAIQMGTVLEILLLSFALADRTKGLQREADAAQSEALVSEQKLVGELKISTSRLERRVVERTEELEKANAQLRVHKRELQALAHTDSLTGLANRLLFDARLQQSMQQVRRGHGQIAVLLIQIDDFSTMSDRYGSAIGEEMLVNMSERFRAAVREVDTVARLEDAEFGIVLTTLGSSSDAERVAEKLVDNLAVPIRVLGMLLEVSVSIGLAKFTGGELSLPELLRRADQAKHAAKESGGGCYRVFAG
ncbi:MAG: sensor domain-containing diguanylate cyclase [Sulfuritalea sp.]|nr:sensor domain-containing diguanylate cyclase [Sulfuritalea sp.]